jgi:hypothetical protein
MHPDRRRSIIPNNPGIAIEGLMHGVLQIGLYFFAHPAPWLYDLPLRKYWVPFSPEIAQIIWKKISRKA